MKRSTAGMPMARLVAAVVATCGVASPAVGQAAPAAADTRAPVGRYTEADVRFMQRMIPHHAQALVMTRLVSERSERRDLRLLAERIAISQQDEIALMQRWLRLRGEEVPAEEGASGHHHHHDEAEHVHRHGPDARVMPGMLTADELARLAAATGAAFERLFLEFMIRHHEGALAMVAELFASPGAAQDPETFRFATDVDADQRIEIARMRALLRDPPGPAHQR